MDYVIAIILVGTIVFTIGQAWLIRQLRNHYSRPTPAWPENQAWPKAAIVLSLRGNDPFLVACLRNLIGQNYPDFILQIVIDSESDPAWDAIHAIRKECPEGCLNVSVLSNRRSTCSLKNSSIIQAINNLPTDVEVVAFVDADAITYPNWLRDLVTPFSDPAIGCTTGVRWFAPVDASLGSRLRCYWNILAASVIYRSNIPWGGSMVVRRPVLDSGLKQEWSRTFCEDACTISYLQKRGLGVACVPEATVVNQEVTTVGGYINFINRQMLICRLYNKRWWCVVATIVFAATLRFANIFFIGYSLIQGDWTRALIFACIFPTNFLTRKYEAAKLDQAVRAMVGKSGRTIAVNPVPQFFGFMMAELMFVNSMLYTYWARYAIWRGISYEINGPEDIQMLAYRPFVETPAFAVLNTATVV